MMLKTCDSYVADLRVWNDAYNTNMTDRHVWYDTNITKCKKLSIMRQTCESNMMMLKTCESNMMMLKTCESYVADLWVWNDVNNTNMVDRQLRYDTYNTKCKQMSLIRQTCESNMMLETCESNMLFDTSESYIVDLWVWYDDYNHAVIIRH